MLIIFSILLYTATLCKASMPLWWKLFPTVWQFITDLWVLLSFLLLSSMFRRLSSQRWTEGTSLNMASICPDPDESLLSQFSPVLLLHINSEQDYLPACQSRCSGEREKKEGKELISLPWTSGIKMCSHLTWFIIVNCYIRGMIKIILWMFKLK